MKRIEDGHFAGDETTSATVNTCRASIRYLLELSKEHGIRRAMLDAFDQIFQAAIKAGHAQDDFAVLSKFMRGAWSRSPGSWHSSPQALS